jgi:sarcosine oxidase subunit gamma
MADLVRRGPLDGVPPIAHANTTVTVALPLARAIARGAAGSVFGIDLPTDPCRAATQGEIAALWLGPDEWLILIPFPSPLEGRLAPGLEPGGQGGGWPAGTVIDVSHRQIALIADGPLAATLLNGACPRDPHLSTFPVGMCTRTVLAKAEIVLWRQAEQRFHLEVARSFATYVHELLREIASTL